MNFEEGLEVADEAVFVQVGRRLSRVEIALLKGSWERQTYEQIAEATNYSVSYLKQHIGPELWKLLAQTLGEEVSKTNFRCSLEWRWRQKAGARESRDKGEIEQSSPPVHQQDWGEAVDVSVFYGRSTELAMLGQWIVTDRCRLVTILGMGGIGKTALAVKLAHQIQGQFEYVIWRSLRNAPPLETLLSELVPLVSNQQETKAEIERLLHYLRASCCLVILDNLETILATGHAGEYRPGHEGYGELIKVIGEAAHQSCLILTSREKPVEIAALEGVELSVRCFRLNGSIEAAQALLQPKGLVGSKIQRQGLCNRYGNNPLAIKIVATSIQELFDGEIRRFLEQDTVVFNGIRRLLDQQFYRLSALEKTVMYWLAINREWTTISELHSDIVPVVSRANLLEALEALSGRSLIEKQSGSYTQQPVVMEYVTDCLTEHILNELVTAKPFLFIRHALIKTTVKDYLRESNVRLILQPIADQLRSVFSLTKTLEQQIHRVIGLLHEEESMMLPGYGGGNLLNLCCHLQLDLTGYDFSKLTIQHAYLKNVNLHQVNFNHADLSKSVFTQTFSDIFCVAFSPDGNLLVTGEPSGDIRLWQVADSQLLWACKGHTNWVMAVAWSPDGTTIASSSTDYTVKLWEAYTGQALKTLQGHTNSVYSLSWSPDGKMIATGSEDHTIGLWDVQTGQVLKMLKGHKSWVWSVHWSPNAKMIASGSVDHTIKLWDVLNGQVLQTLQGHLDQVSSVVWSPDGKMIASGSVDHTIKLWDVQTGQVLKTLQGHTNWVRAVAWSPDGTLVASGGDDCIIKLWDVQTGQVLKTLQGHTNWVRAVAWSPDGTLVASGSVDHMVKLWDVQTGQALRTLQGYTNWLHSVVWSPNGKMIASGSEDQMVRVWDALTGKALKTLQGHTNWVMSVAWSPDGTMIASSSADRTVKIWDSRAGITLRTLEGHKNWVLSASWSPDGTLIASSSVDHTIELWDVQTGRAIKTLRGHTDWVWSVIWSPDGKMIASGSADHTVRLWDALTGEALKTLPGHTDSVRTVAWNLDGTLVASGSGDYTVKLWDVQTGQVLKTFSGHTNSVSSVAWSPDGRTIASGGQDHTIKLWNVQTGEVLKTLQGHTSWVNTVAYAPKNVCRLKGDILTSGGTVETIKLWDTDVGVCLKTFKNVRLCEGLNITGVTGITEAQKLTLKALGAVEDEVNYDISIKISQNFKTREKYP